MHVSAVPEQPSPDQPVNRCPVEAVAVKVTVVPTANVFEHEVPQLTPVGLDDTDPIPTPALTTVNVLGTALKVAVTVLADVIDTMHAPVPLQEPPDQPPKVCPTEGVAVNETRVPIAKVARQVEPQLIPAGFEVTVPVPEPVLVTVKLVVDALTASTGSRDVNVTAAVNPIANLRKVDVGKNLLMTCPPRRCADYRLHLPHGLDQPVTRVTQDPRIESKGVALHSMYPDRLTYQKGRQEGFEMLFR